MKILLVVGGRGHCGVPVIFGRHRREMLLRGAEHAHVPARDRRIKLPEGAPHAFRCSRWRRDAVADRGQAFCYRIPIVNVPTATETCRRLQLVVRVHFLAPAYPSYVGDPGPAHLLTSL